MKSFTINDFWKKKIISTAGTAATKLTGWYFNISPLNTFKEAPLTAGDKFGNDSSPDDSDIILVSAPGAVGKTTLARQISAETGAIYIDLAEAEPVGGNTLSGGLAKSGLYTDWKSGKAIVLIDGLDEARLKVTQPAFEAFLSDIAEISAGRGAPTVLFGRSGAIEEAWLHLSDKANICVLEIGYYAPDDALEFALTHLTGTVSVPTHISTRREAIKLILERLRQDTERDGDRFAGYAPVLMAVADQVGKESNPSTLVSKIKNGTQPVTLQTIVGTILEREQSKLAGLPFEDASLASKLYSPAEQLERLAAHIYQTAKPPVPAVSAGDAEVYANALTSWVPEHPFLDGSMNPASAVFGAVIAAAALKERPTAEAVLMRELAKGAAANPFLSEFYLDGLSGRNLPPEHVGVIYASIRSRLSLDDHASLTVEGVDEGDELELLKSEIEISVARSDTDRIRAMHFMSEQAGILRLGSHLEDAEINTPHAHVELGGPQEIVLVAPISIQCAKLTFLAPRLIAETQTSQDIGVVFLEAEEADATRINSPPLVNGGAKLSVAWPNANAFPWTAYATTPSEVYDPRVDEAIRRFRKFIISFRSHSKGSLKRYAAKIEHERMTKGAGHAVLKHLVQSGILSSDGTMYTLHPDILANMTGASYGMCMSRNFPAKTIEFVTQALQQET